jgi:fructuronate reductase
VQREASCNGLEDLTRPGDPDWASVGVTLTSDVAAFERAKLRILNGAHSTLAYLGLSGLYDGGTGHGAAGSRCVRAPDAS